MFCMIVLEKCWMSLLKLLFVGCKPSILMNAPSDMNIFQKRARIARLSGAFDDFWALSKRWLKSHRMPPLTILLFSKKCWYGQGHSSKSTATRPKTAVLARAFNMVWTTCCQNIVFCNAFQHSGSSSEGVWKSKQQYSQGHSNFYK